MFTRYKTDERGRSIPVARIYTAKEHNVHNSRIDKDALWAIRRIQAAGEQAYIVGGAVRDLLLGRNPKDFDIATSASPRQVQRLFWNSRIIGRRFRIVHIFFGNKIIEVTTFRSDEENFEEGNNNIFGTIEQDSKRRDFSINALYYNPTDGHLVDFNNSMEDFKKRRIRSLIPLKYSFSEDPVRMIRALKYKNTTGFRLKLDVAFSLRRNASNIQGASISRLTDEMIKIFNCGSSYGVLTDMKKYGLLGYIMPCYAQYFSLPAVHESLKTLDERVTQGRNEGGKVPSFAEALSIIAAPLILPPDTTLSAQEAVHEVFRQIKVLLAPMTPPNYELERAAELILASYGVKTVKKKKPRSGASPAPRAKGPADRKRGKRKKSGAAIPRVAEDHSEAVSSAEAHDI